MSWQLTPPEPPDFGDTPPCPHCGDTEWAHVPLDCTWVDGEYAPEMAEVLWECEVCHKQYWAGVSA